MTLSLRYSSSVADVPASVADRWSTAPLPGPDGPVAQFMYQDAAGKRLTLYVSRNRKGENVTAFRFARDANVSTFYWIDRECGYALSGELDKPALSKVAASVYRQLEQD